MASSRTARTSSGMISGVGLASAKITGRSAMVATISGLSTLPADRPRNTSAPFMASCRLRASVMAAWADFHWFMPSVRP